MVENPIVYSGEGQEAALNCIVHGETQPEVIPCLIMVGIFKLIMELFLRI